MMRFLVLLLLSVVALLGQTPNVTLVLNAASGQPSLTPGGLTAVLGTNLSVGSCTAATSPAPTTLCEAQVTIGGRAAAMLAASPTSMNVQIPVELQPGEVELVVQRQTLRSTPVRITLNRHAPGLYTTPEGYGTIFRPIGAAVTPAAPANPGDQLALLAVGLGPTNPAVVTGSTPSGQAATTTLPTLMVGNQPAVVTSAVLSASQVGNYVVNFTVPTGVTAGNLSVRLEIGGVLSNTVPMAVTAARVPSITGIVNGASFAPDAVAAPGTILSIFGTNFGSRDNLNAFPQIDVDGLSVMFDASRASLFAVVASGGQINVLAPNDLPESGSASVRVATSVSTSANFQVRLVPAAPGIFRLTDPSNSTRRNAAVLFANTAWLAMPGSMARAMQIPDNCSGRSAVAICGQPAAPGDVLQVFVTGLGRATPGGDPTGRPLPLGSVAPADGNPLYRTLLTPAVAVGGVPAEVVFSGLAPGFAGLYQINIRTPASAPAGDDVPLQVSMPNGASDTATIAIRR
jgi:uncharacterized protein (TIGR03437 family)